MEAMKAASAKAPAASRTPVGRARVHDEIMKHFVAVGYKGSPSLIVDEEAVVHFACPCIADRAVPGRAATALSPHVNCRKMDSFKSHIRCEPQKICKALL